MIGVRCVYDVCGRRIWLLCDEYVIVFGNV